MDTDYFDDFPDEKKKKCGSGDRHRWTHEETIQLLKSVALMEKNGDQFEQPTARQFYEKLKNKYFTNLDLSFIVVKNKIRHLKNSYLKAVEWKDSVAMEASDQTHIYERVKNICPYYNLLDDVFGTVSNSRLRLPDDFETISFVSPTKKAKADNTDTLIVPKMEVFCDEQNYYGEETLDTTNNDELEDSVMDHEQSQPPRCRVFTKKTNKASRRQNAQTESMSLEEKKFQLEEQRFQAYYTFESRRMKLEENKFKFEVDKFKKSQKMKKYEIDKRFALYKQKIESNERIRLLELGKADERATVTLPITNEADEVPFEDLTDKEDEDDDHESEQCAEFTTDSELTM